MRDWIFHLPTCTLHLPDRKLFLFISELSIKRMLFITLTHSQLEANHIKLPKCSTVWPDRSLINISLGLLNSCKNWNGISSSCIFRKAFQTGVCPGHCPAQGALGEHITHMRFYQSVGWHFCPATCKPWQPRDKWGRSLLLLLCGFLTGSEKLSIFSFTLVLVLLINEEGR